MTKSEFIEKIAGDERIDSKKGASDAVEAVLDGIVSSLTAGDDVNFTGFGKFSVNERGPSQGVNPRTGERITIPGGKVPKFSAGAGLKSAVKGLDALTALRRPACGARRRAPQPGLPRARPGPRSRAMELGSGAGRRRARPSAPPRPRRRPASELIDRAGPACVAVKPQLARFEALGSPGWAALEAGRRGCPRGRPAGDRRRQARRRAGQRRRLRRRPARLHRDALGRRSAGLGADAATVNPLMGADSLEPLVETAPRRRRRPLRPRPHLQSRRGRPARRRARPTAPLHERIARRVDALADRLAGAGELERGGRGRRRDRAALPRPPARADAAGDPAAARRRRPGRRGRGPRRRLHRARRRRSSPRRAASPARADPGGRGRGAARVGLGARPAEPPSAVPASRVPAMSDPTADPTAALREAIAAACADLHAGVPEASLERPPRPELGDYSTNAAMLAAPLRRLAAAGGRREARGAGSRSASATTSTGSRSPAPDSSTCTWPSAWCAGRRGERRVGRAELRRRARPTIAAPP